MAKPKPTDSASSSDFAGALGKPVAQSKGLPESLTELQPLLGNRLPKDQHASKYLSAIHLGTGLEPKHYCLTLPLLISLF